MIDLLSYIPQKRKNTSSGWVSFNAPCCVYKGESQDKRLRGGIKQTDDDWSYHCFNCGFTASFIAGRSVGYKARKLLEWLGVDSVSYTHLPSPRDRQKSRMPSSA